VVTVKVLTVGRPDVDTKAEDAIVDREAGK
jgi:hypothetical protein